MTPRRDIRLVATEEKTHRQMHSIIQRSSVVMRKKRQRRTRRSTVVIHPDLF